MPGGRPVQLIVMVLVYCGAAFADWADCPSPCQCKWSSGKKTALCKDAEFTDVPSSLDADMQVLDLSSNPIRHLPEDVFKKVGLLNLQRVFLRGCGIRNVHKDAFRELKILIELDLSDNLIDSLHQETFQGNERLRVLYLNGNPLTEVKEVQFPVLQHLRTLELQHCQIKRIHRDAFLHLASLESLNLNGNKLKWISETVFLPVSKLKTLSLDGNPWECDCRLRSFRDWFVGSNLYSHPLSCIEPEVLAGNRWENIKPLDFACAPNVRIDRSSVLEDAGNNVTFTCKVTGDPEPEVSWYFNGRAVDNRTGRMDENRTWPEDGQVWSALSVFNVSDAVAGEFACEARNSRGRTSANVTLELPEVAVATTLSETRSVYVVAVCAAASATVLLFAVGLTCCLCRANGSGGGGGRRGELGGKSSAFKGSSSFSDADKRLLDASISTTQAGSCEMLGGGSPSCQDLELVEQSLSLQNVPLAAVCGGGSDQQPVHITIESHDPGTGVSVYPPPPEFSTSILPSVGGFGNIFISVSVSQEPPPPDAGSECRYPDLLDMKHRHLQRQSVSVGTDPTRHHQHQRQHQHHQQQQQQQQQRQLPDPSPPYYHAATVPRKKLQQDDLHRRVGGRSDVKPHYDNMGPRITATGSCTNLSSLSNSGGSSDDIPPPPPPPLCTGHTTDYVAL